MIAILVSAALVAYCGGYAVKQAKERRWGPALVLAALCVMDLALLYWLTTM